MGAPIPNTHPCLERVKAPQRPLQDEEAWFYRAPDIRYQMPLFLRERSQNNDVSLHQTTRHTLWGSRQTKELLSQVLEFAHATKYPKEKYQK